MSSPANSWSLSQSSNQPSDVERANRLSCFRPEAREYLLKLFSTQDFKSKNLKYLEEANQFYSACSDIVGQGAGKIRFRCALATVDGPSACGVTYERPDRFADHLHQHLDMKPYKCDCNEAECIPPMTFTSHAALKTHTSGNKKAECQYCHKSFVIKNMARHHGSMLCMAAQEAAQSSSAT